MKVELNVPMYACNNRWKNKKWKMKKWSIIMSFPMVIWEIVWKHSFWTTLLKQSGSAYHKGLLSLKEESKNFCTTTKRIYKPWTTMTTKGSSISLHYKKLGTPFELAQLVQDKQATWRATHFMIEIKKNPENKTRMWEHFAIAPETRVKKYPLLLLS